MTADDRVLLVDDEEDFVESLAKRLDRRGLRVETSSSGEQALEMVRRRSFDVIVLDLAMPGLDGIATLERLKQLDPDLQVILLTGHATVPKSVEAMKLGAADLLEKPADFAELLTKIREAGAKKAVLVEKRRADEVAEILMTRGW
jgi:DNA-binding NtrC family response regulator